MTDVAILMTGGTLDKVHDTYTEGLVFPTDGSSQLGDVLTVGRTDHPRLVPVLQIDSLDLCDAGRAHILSAVLTAPERAIVITHGTGTMDKTAMALHGRCCDKTVVITGAMRPVSLGASDGGFNVGGALIAAQILPAGVYAVMNGRVFSAREIYKDVKSGCFTGSPYKAEL